MGMCGSILDPNAIVVTEKKKTGEIFQPLQYRQRGENERETQAGEEDAGRMEGERVGEGQ